MDQDQDQKLIVFLDSLGQDADVDFARGVLEAHDWDVEAALLTVTGAGEAPSAPSAALDGLDEEGYRAPMRTGYHDTLLGPTPEDFARAAADAQRGDLGAGGPDGAGGRHDRAGRDMDLAMQASRGHRQQEQGAIAQAMQASLAAHMEMEQRRYEGGANADAERNEEQKMIAQAIEASYRESSAADASFRESIERATAASLGAEAPAPSRPSPAPSPAASAHALPERLRQRSAVASAASVSRADPGDRAPGSASRELTRTSDSGAPRDPGDRAAGSASRELTRTSGSGTAPRDPGDRAAGSASRELARTSGSRGAARDPPARQPVQPPSPSAYSGRRPPGVAAPDRHSRYAAHPPAGERGQAPAHPRAGERGQAQPADAAEDEHQQREALRSQQAQRREAQEARERAAEGERQQREAQQRLAAEASRRAEREAREARLAEAKRLQREAAEAERRRQEEAEERRREAAQAERRRLEEAEERGWLAAEAERSRLEEEAERGRLAVEAERRRLEQAEENVELEAIARDAARKHKEKEVLDLAREKEEAEARQREEERATQPAKKEADLCVTALVALRKRYREADAEGLATCLKTLRAYINNLAQNPSEPKFQRINSENGAFRQRVAPYEGSIAVLQACGFHQEPGALVVDPSFVRSKGPKLFEALAKVDVMIEQLQ